MMALARRSVVEARVDVLLKIGLGSMGKVSSMGLLQCIPISPLEHPGRPDPREIHLRRVAAPQWQREESQGLPPRQERSHRHGQPSLPQAARSYRTSVPVTRMVRPRRTGDKYRLCPRRPARSPQQHHHQESYPPGVPPAREICVLCSRGPAVVGAKSGHYGRGPTAEHDAGFDFDGAWFNARDFGDQPSEEER